MSAKSERVAAGLPEFWTAIVAVLLVSILVGCSSNVVVKPDLVWPAPPEKTRIKFVKMLKDDRVFPKSFMKGVIEGVVGAERKISLLKPYGVAVDSAGRVYVTDTGLGAVVIFDRVAEQVRTLGASGQGKLATPIGIAVSDKIVYVSDSHLKRVFGFDANDNLIVTIGHEGELESPSGIAFDDVGKQLYVVDAGKHSIRVYSEGGDPLFSFGGRGSANGQFNYPTNVFIRNGKVYVMDTMNFRVQVFDLHGKFLSLFGSAGNKPGFFSRPKGIAVSAEGFIFVVDAAFDNFQVFDEQGQVYMYVGGPGTGEGFFNLPAGLHIDKKNFIYVVDQLNSRIQVFQFLGDN